MVIVATVGVLLGWGVVAWIRKLIPRFNDLLDLSKG